MTDARHQVPQNVLSAFGFENPDLVMPLSGGLINRTVLVGQKSRLAVLQRVHRIFPPETTLDVHDVCTRLKEQGFPAFDVLHTTDRALYVPEGDVHWRALSFLGDSASPLASLRQSEVRDPEAAGRTLGAFHGALHGWPHTFRHHRRIHRPLEYALHLEDVLETYRSHALYDDVARASEEILERIGALYGRVDAGLTGIVHGDPKIENMMRMPDGRITMVDLDTVGVHPVAFELGDAMRSWCDEGGTFSMERFETALSAYFRASPYTDNLSLDVILSATALIAWELASRFAADALEESYFSWDADAYPTAGHHNLQRMRQAISYARSVPV